MKLSKSVTRQYYAAGPRGLEEPLGIAILVDYADVDDEPAHLAVLAGVAAWHKSLPPGEMLSWEVVYERFRACFPTLAGVDYTIDWYTPRGVKETREIQ